MLDRIKEIMHQKGLSPSGFADIIKVQRSSISHILNGRNKPSLELIQKIITAFPDIDIEWLITGKRVPKQEILSKEKEIDEKKFGSEKNLLENGLNIEEIEIEKIVIFYKNATFKIYQPK